MKYLNPTYDEMIKKSYAFDYMAQHSKEWIKVRELYEQNYVNTTDVVPNIPKKIHQIWLGSPLPDKYKMYTKSWVKKHPDWEYKLWTDKDASSIHIEKREIFDKATNQGMKSDILRYEILRQFGGLYVDTDFECLKPFDDLLYLDFFTGIGYDSLLQLYIGLIASVPHHIILDNTLSEIKSDYTGNKGSVIMNTTGANIFTKAFVESVRNNTTGVVAFPPDFFYPFPNNVRKTDYPYQYVQECSYAIHHWAVSWSKAKIKILV